MTRCKALLRGTVSITLASIVALSVAGCGGSSAQGPDAAEADRVRASDRLKGRWMLVDFRPDQPLEPMLAALLGAQLGHLAVSFDGQWLLAEGIGVRAQRSYVVQDAAGDGLHLVVRDDVGATYDVVGTFRGNDLEFSARTSPWQGAGRLTRMQ
ncbi:MAG TPA: hypothetical protein VHE30_11875 [Polyangiaceae bacterium]|nr:hypothetical protein [Polyangiaceae bacterium]